VKSTRIGLILLSLVFNATNVAAQTLPDAGMLRQQIEQGNKSIIPAPIIPEQVAPTTLKKLTGTVLVVKSFKFSGNTRISSEVLQTAVASFLNRSLDFAQLQDAAAVVGNVYRDAGWVVRAYLPQQEIEEGIVTIEVVEAVFGGARFEGGTSVRLPNAMIQKYVEAAQKVGEPLYAPAIDRALLILSDIPGATVSGNLREGKAAGQTELILNALDKFLLTSDASTDNTGSLSTGTKHFSANLSLNSPLGWGDLFNTNFMFSEGSGYGRLAYGMPVGYAGWRAGLNGSFMSFKVITPESKALNVLGSSTSFGGEVSYPVIRSRLKNLNLALNYDHKYFNNEANQTKTTEYVIDAVAVALNGSLVDDVMGGGSNNAGLSWTSGRVNLNGSPNQTADAATTRTDGRYNKLHYTVSRLQTATDTVAVYASLSGQMAANNLDSGEKFYLGGSNGVRAYPSSEGGGTDGQLLSVELQTRLPHGINLTGFYDWGHVTVNHDNSFAGAPSLNNLSLQGFGIALGGGSSFGLNLKATWARRIGSNPNPTATGNDQDGTLIRNRFWFLASKQF
jgi:hemolysin activation/secretion protein